MGLYEIGGRLYDPLQKVLTLGGADRVKREAISELGITAGAKVLDWGCGTGLSLKCVRPYLEDRGRVYAVDASPAMMKMAVGRARPTDELDYRFILRRGSRIDLPEPVDFVVASYSLGVLSSREFESAIECIWNCTRPGGRLLVIDMYLPEVKTRLQKSWQGLWKVFSRKLYRQDFSGTLLPTVERYFRTVRVEFRRPVMAFYFIGQRREVPEAAPDAPPSHDATPPHQE